MNTESQILNIPIEDIIPNRFQPRINFDDSSLQELAASIKEHGIIQPLVLRRLGDKYEIVAGERRYKASKLAGLTSVPAIISSLDDISSAEVAIVENIQRRDLSSIEEAKSYRSLLDKGYLTQEELAKKMGLSQSAISNKLRLLSLSQNVQDALMQGKISERHARSLLKINDFQEQEKWLNRIINERLTVRDLDNLIKDINKESENMNNNMDTELLEVEDNKIDNNNVFVTDNFKAPDEKPIPNKFFNFLEDEVANMNTEEEEEKEEEVEMLDFEAPVVENVKHKDMAIATSLIDNLLSQLNDNNYKVSLDKEVLDDKVKYVISIDNKE